MNKGLMSRVFQAVGLGIVASMLSITNVSAQSLEDSFSKELKLVEGLKVYNDQLQQQLKAQDTAKVEIAESVNEAKNLEPQIVPVMVDMVKALDIFVKSDLPFRMDERLEGIANLQAAMVSPDLDTSDRFRSIMDIYTVETEYGNTYEAYAEVQQVNGETIEVDMLRLGRLALYFQTKDGSYSAMWDKSSNAWVALPESSNRHLRKAIKVAAKQIAPEVMNLPIAAPKGL